MADTKISAATAVTTPASTDEYATNQGGASKRTTRAQMHAAESGEVILADFGTAAAPGFAFNGDAGTGFIRTGSGIVQFSGGGAAKWQIDTAGIQGLSASSGRLMNEIGSATNPTHTFNGEGNSGMGLAADDAPCMISGAIESQRWTEASSKVLTAVDASTAITANTNSSQGDTPLTSSFNIIATCATTGDAVTLPAVFTATTPSTIVYVKNDGAQSCDVFPALGDDAGGGTDTAVAVAAGNFAVFIATAANATWTKLMGGTA